MALRPLLLSAVIGLASVCALHSPAAEARGYVSVSIGHPPPPRHERYAHRPGYAWVPGRRISTGYRHLPPRRVIRHVGRPYRPVYGPTRPGYRVVYRQPGWGW